MSRRFALLLHEHSEKPESRHQDLLLEMDLSLFALKISPPVADFRRGFGALRHFDHRKLYLDYEGPISGDRGFVVRIDGGEILGRVSPEGFELELRGSELCGHYRFEPIGKEGWRVMPLGKSPG